MGLLVMLLPLSLCGDQLLLAPQGAQSYIHHEELMDLVHGTVKGNAIWLWDACCVQHVYFTALCLASISGVLLYKISVTVHTKVNNIIKSVFKLIQEKYYEGLICVDHDEMHRPPDDQN